MGAFRSSGTNTQSLRERHKYTLRQGPLDRKEQEEEEGAERKSECSRVDVLRGGRQRFAAGRSMRTVARRGQMRKKEGDKIRSHL